MSTAIEFNVTEQIREIVPNVFDMMLATPAVLTKDESPLPTGRISGTIGIAGESVTGAIYLHLPEPLARSAACTMLGDPTGQTIGDDETNDAVGELTNMVAGALKSALCDIERHCAVSTPSVIRGVFEVEILPELAVKKYFFNCLNHRMAVEVHLKFE